MKTLRAIKTVKNKLKRFINSYVHELDTSTQRRLKWIIHAKKSVLLNESQGGCINQLNYPKLQKRPFVSLAFSLDAIRPTLCFPAQNAKDEWACQRREWKSVSEEWCRTRERRRSAKWKIRNLADYFFCGRKENHERFFVLFVFFE